jgi:thiamine biosynthesis lipoprotein
MKILNSLILLTLIMSCSSPSKPIHIEGKTMGTYYKVTTYGSDSPEKLKEEVDKFLKYFNLVFSTYIPESEISRINNSKFDNNKITDTLKKLLELSNIIARKSLGFFDITVAPLVNAWGFGPSGKQKKPTDQETKELLKIIGHERIKIKKNRLHMPVSMRLDLSAIAKGFGVDELIKFLEFRGYDSILVEIGGEVRTRGQKFDGSEWRVGVEGPGEKLGAKIIRVIPLKNMSMATSGSYRNYLKYGEAIFNHTINPKTGYPVKHQTISATVVSEYCADADAWATAFMSMGHIKGLDLANKQRLKVLYQVKEGKEIKIYESKSFSKFMLDK